MPSPQPQLPSSQPSVEDDAAGQKRALELARAELEGLYAAAPLGFAFLDRELRFRMVNPVLAEMNGVPREAHPGKTPMELLPQVPADFLITHARRVVETGQPETDVLLETATPATHGATRHFLEHWYPVRVGGEIVGIGVIIEDVTERRRAEAARDRILAVVSHDLRSPLSAILTACSLLFARNPHPDVARVTARIQRSATRMRAIVDQLFDFARLDKLGNLPLARTPFDLGELAQRTVEEVELASSRIDVAVRVELHGGLRGEWDEARIAQVFSNLVGNALQHGERSVVVRVTGLNREVVIEVANEGPPIPPDLLGRIFEPFESSGDDRRHLGLGLFITREIVRAHGGQIEARSGAGRTLFSVRLPRS
jgi:PAS domain S-box-containing protein